MAASVIDLLVERFPRAPALAMQRILARGHTIFFDYKTKKLLPGFTEEEVFASLFIAKTVVAEANAELVLTSSEEPFFRGFLVPPTKRQ
jgi:hypothetical protein